MIAAVPRSTPLPQESLEKLFSEHGQMVYRTAFRVTGSSLDAEDVLQTVFLRLAARKDLCEMGPRPAAYLHRAAVNGALDLVRSKLCATGTIPLEGREMALRSRETLPGEDLETQELRARLRRAIGRLSPRVAEVFVLRALEGLPNREIARLVGSSPAVVAVQYVRARTQLRKELVNQTGGPS